ncbi:(2Fe-2S)-binding protein [Cohnella sp. JJ-181]|uniref:(2Fe-2S)-binding protein n=1 Tax=Cohnella rhizoplanae TaxID=2974897 RepID=UPI0022FF6D42|nr:(2Fe-2S)-binding protein [Cohnella sp. JJ-181]CAI6055901.1 hypothetical protein COHCIP112018_01674 [Cohnella sp. JJ-181]
MNERQLKEACHTQFGVVSERAAGALFTIPGRELADNSGMKRLLAAYGPLIKALDAQVPASYFCGSLTMLGMSLHTALSEANRTIDLDLDNLVVEIRMHEGGYPAIVYRLKSWRSEEGPASPASRDAWLMQAYTRLYGDVMRPIVESAASVSGAPVGSLWGQLPSKYQYYMRVRKDGLPEGSRMRERIEEDYERFVRQLPATVFGRARHPFDLKIKSVPSLTDPHGTAVMKSACCLYHRTDGGAYCYTCPKLKEEDRAERRAAYLSQQAVRT